MSSTLSGIIQSLRTIAAVFIVVLTHTSLATASVLIQDLIPQGSYQPSQGLLLHHSLYRLCAQILLSPVMLSQSLIFPRNTKLCRIRQLCWITVTHWLPLEAGCTEIPQQHHLNCSRMSIKCVVMLQNEECSGERWTPAFPLLCEQLLFETPHVVGCMWRLMRHRICGTVSNTARPMVWHYQPKVSCLTEWLTSAQHLACITA